MKLYRQEQNGQYLATVWLSGIISVLCTRLFLRISGYPTIGRGVWHLSHAIWGGIAMCIGMFMALGFYGRRTKQISAVIFGLGMGMFFDEIGKLVTRDYNYFFKPTGMIIYILFLSLFALYRMLQKKQTKGPVYTLYSILDRIGELAEDDLDEREQKSLLLLIDRLKESDGSRFANLADGFRSGVLGWKTKKYQTNKWLAWWRNGRRTIYKTLFKRKSVLTLLSILAIGYSVLAAVDTVLLIQNRANPNLLRVIYGEYGPNGQIELFLLALKIISDGVTGVFFILGIIMVIFKRSRRGLMLFCRGLMIHIGLTSVFRFYFEQFSAVFGLLFSLILYTGLNRLRLEKAGK